MRDEFNHRSRGTGARFRPSLLREHPDSPGLSTKKSYQTTIPPGRRTRSISAATAARKLAARIELKTVMQRDDIDALIVERKFAGIAAITIARRKDTISRAAAMRSGSRSMPARFAGDAPHCTKRRSQRPSPHPTSSTRCRGQRPDAFLRQQLENATLEFVLENKRTRIRFGIPIRRNFAFAPVVRRADARQARLQMDWRVSRQVRRDPWSTTFFVDRAR